MHAIIYFFASSAFRAWDHSLCLPSRSSRKRHRRRRTSSNKCAPTPCLVRHSLAATPVWTSLLVNDLSGSYSGMMFDYAYVNESLVVNPTTITTTTTSGMVTGTSTVTPSSGSQYVDHFSIMPGAGTHGLTMHQCWRRRWRCDHLGCCDRD